MRRIAVKRVLLVTTLSLIAMNFVAYRHAISMCHFSPSGERTRPPEQLSLASKVYTLLFGVTVPRPKLTERPNRYDLAYTTHQFISRDGAVLEAWHIPSPGSTKTALLFHGYAASKSSLLSTAALFHQLGISCFLVDFYGSGGSSGSSTSIGFHEAENVMDAIAYVQKQWPSESLILYSISMGSAAVLRAAALHDIQVEALILESPFDTLLHTVSNRFTAMGLPSTGLSEILVFWGGIIQGYNGFSFKPFEYAKSVHVPTLLLYGSNDPRVLSEERKRLYQNLAGPKVYKEFAGASHELLSEVEPKKWANEIKSFLTKVEYQKS